MNRHLVKLALLLFFCVYPKVDSSFAQFVLDDTGIKSGRLALSIVTDETKHSSLWIIDFARRKFYQPSDTGFDLNGETPDWSPDGKSLIFASPDRNSKNIYAWDGGTIRVLTSQASIDEDPQYSSGGSVITFLRKPLGKARSLWIMNEFGEQQEETYAPQAEIYSPRVSPKVTEILVVTDSDWPGKDLLLIPLKDGKPRMLTTGPINYTRPAWHPSGESIAMTIGSGEELDLGLMKRAKKGEDPGEPEYLTRDRGVERNPEWSETGEFLFYIKQIGETSSEIWTIVPATKKKTLILKAEGIIKDISWTKFPGTDSSVPKVTYPAMKPTEVSAPQKSANPQESLDKVEPEISN